MSPNTSEKPLGNGDAIKPVDRPVEAEQSTSKHALHLIQHHPGIFFVDLSRRRSQVEQESAMPPTPILKPIGSADAHQTLGQGAEGVLTRPIIEFVHPEDRAATIKDPSASLPVGSKESVFNYEKALRQVGDEELLHELIELFLDKVPKVVAELGDALGSLDYETVRQRTHTLKGSVGLLCAQRTYTAALDLEHRVAERNTPECELQFARLKEEVEQLQLVLTSIIRPRVGTVALGEE